jgi:hypothetical protein
MKSKKILITGLLILGIIVIITILNFIGNLARLNQPLNKLIVGNADKSCNSESDCVIRKTTCLPCDCGDAVNKNWHTYCPFSYNAKYLCKMCASQNYDFYIKCIEGQCQRVWTSIEYDDCDSPFFISEKEDFNQTVTDNESAYQFLINLEPGWNENTSMYKDYKSSKISDIEYKEIVVSGSENKIAYVLQDTTAIDSNGQIYRKGGCI